MTDPGDLETYELEEVDEPVDHIFCGHCTEASIYLCGTPRAAADTVIDAGEPAPISDHVDLPNPCVVCFGAKSLRCSGCGTEISTCL